MCAGCVKAAGRDLGSGLLFRRGVHPALRPFRGHTFPFLQRALAALTFSACSCLTKGEEGGRSRSSTSWPEPRGWSPQSAQPHEGSQALEPPRVPEAPSDSLHPLPHLQTSDQASFAPDVTLTPQTKPAPRYKFSKLPSFSCKAHVT